jgi:excisionase family DNA binding protein
MLQRMLTVPEAAKRTGRNPETLRRWIREGRLRSTKIGTQHLIDEQDLDVLVTTDEVVARTGGDVSATGEPVPNFVAALNRSRSGR